MDTVDGIHCLRWDRYLWEQRIHGSIHGSQEVDTQVITGDNDASKTPIPVLCNRHARMDAVWLFSGLGRDATGSPVFDDREMAAALSSASRHTGYASHACAAGDLDARVAESVA
jgi:hypothetical protein